MKCRYLAIMCLMLFLAFPVQGAEWKATSPEEIRDLMKKAGPGDTIVMANGVWADERIGFKGNGAEGAPITLRAETPGKVIITGQSALEIRGSYLVADGLLFKDISPEISTIIKLGDDVVPATHHCRLTNTAIVWVGAPQFDRRVDGINVYGHHNRVDHCWFTGHNTKGVTLVVRLDGKPDFHRIDYNYFGNRPKGTSNGFETIRVGSSQRSLTNSNTLVEHNLFERCDGEIEVISNKSCENIYRYNTFRECKGQLTLRHGNRCVVDGNYFLQNHKKGSSGVRVIGEDHKVVNNYFEKTGADDGSSGSQAAVVIMNGVPNSPLNRYFQVKNALIAHNTFVDCTSSIAVGVAYNGTTLPPVNCTIANNLVLSGGRPIIDYVTNPIDISYEGNMMYGGPLGIPPQSGIRQIDPKLVEGADGVWRPAKNSPARGAAQGTCDAVWRDIDGQPREPQSDVGCDQLSKSPRKNRPLTSEDVGPVWMNSGSIEGEDPLPPTIIAQSEPLWELQLRATAGHPDLMPEIKSIIKKADEALTAGPFSVTLKAMTPESGDKRDYMSMSPYWWPDPSKPDGLPYIRRDGKVNPERELLTDRDNYHGMRKAVRNLAIAYHLTGREQYATKAVELIKAFFLDEKTRMNPNMKFAQSVPGMKRVRGTGIIDTSTLPSILDSFALLRTSDAWNDEIETGLKSWFGQLLDWLVTSEQGKDEALSENNHGSNYDSQVIAYAVYTGRLDLARDMVETFKTKRIARQIEPDGRQPLELARTRPWHYSLFNLEPHLRIAFLARHVGIDLWNYETDDGRSIRKAIEWLAPYAIGEKEWVLKDLDKFDGARMFFPLRCAEIVYDDPKFAEWAAALPDEPDPGLQARMNARGLMYVKPAVR